MPALLGRAALVAALVLTGLEMSPTAAHADDPTPPPITVITSPPLVLNDPNPPMTISIGTDPVGNPVPIIVNPGGTAPIAAECVGLLETIQQLCAGTSSNDPYIVSGTPTPLGSPPGDELDWIVEEAIDGIADAHGVVNDDLVRGYARPDIRAYVSNRMADILNKRLYDKPMTQREIKALPVIQAFFKAQWTKAAERALAEYELWNDSPCSYVPPQPPAGSGLDFVPNPVASTAMCLAGGGTALWQIVDNTPPASTFDTWAAYRFPTPTMLHTKDVRFRGMVGMTNGAHLALGGLATAATAGVGIGLGTVGATMAYTAAESAMINLELSSLPMTGTYAAIAGPAIIIAIALIILMVATHLMEEDAKTGEELRKRVASTASSNDVLGIQASQAAYAGLDILTRQDPAVGEKAFIHTDAFKQGIQAMVNEWLSFDAQGQLIPDPTVGATGVNPTPTDLTYKLGGVAQTHVDLKAPTGASDKDGNPVDAYRIKLHRGWMWVSERRTSTGQYGAWLPRMVQTYLNTDGKTAQVQLVRNRTGSAPAKIQFELTRQGTSPYSESDTWTYLDPAGVARTVTLASTQPVLPQVNVLPTVTGTLIADHEATFSANLSDPGAGLAGSYAWVITRVDDNGDVVETIDVPDDATVTARLLDPGRYRAEVHFAEAGPSGIDRYGLLEFKVEPPAPKILSIHLRDDRILNGSMFLDLNMEQETRQDDFTVKVDWATDFRGDVISKTYDVQCVEDTGSPTPYCGTGTLVAPETAPTNPQWSESPTFLIPPDQNFLPYVRVTIANRFGERVERVFPVTGDHRPSYADSTPSAVMAAGTDSTVDVVQVFPSSLLTQQCLDEAIFTPLCGELSIDPYVTSILEQLPPGVLPRVTEKPDHTWWLQLIGSPQADAVGEYVFYFPFAQEPVFMNLRPAPALASVEIVPSIDEGYRAVLRGTPSRFTDRSYRNVYPDYKVEVNQVIGAGGSFSDFTGTVKCRLVAGPTTVFDKACQAGAPFPWPDERVTGTLEASVYLESDTQELADDGPYVVNLITRFVDPTVTQVASPKKNHVRFELRLDDNGVKLPPYPGYAVTCSRDGGAFSACFGTGSIDLPKVPGPHTLDVRAKAPDGATTTQRVDWNGGGPLPAMTLALEAKPAGAAARKQSFTLAISRGGALPTPYSTAGYSVTCSADGKAIGPCFDTGGLTLLRTPGRHTLQVTATGFDGALVARTLTWKVATPAARLKVSAPSSGRAGARIAVKARKLLPREKYVVTIGGTKVGSGKADDRGKVSVSVRIPSGLRPGVVDVALRGATAKRQGKVALRVIR